MICEHCDERSVGETVKVAIVLQTPGWSGEGSTGSRSRTEFTVSLCPDCRAQILGAGVFKDA